jgi:polyferredoxin
MLILLGISDILAWNYVYEYNMIDSLQTLGNFFTGMFIANLIGIFAIVKIIRR